MKNGFEPVLIEINHLVDVRMIEVDGTIYELNVVLGGDYKV